MQITWKARKTNQNYSHKERKRLSFASTQDIYAFVILFTYSIVLALKADNDLYLSILNLLFKRLGQNAKSVILNLWY